MFDGFALSPRDKMILVVLIVVRISTEHQDERSLDDPDEPLAEREDGDEELGVLRAGAAPLRLHLREQARESRNFLEASVEPGLHRFRVGQRLPHERAVFMFFPGKCLQCLCDFGAVHLQLVGPNGRLLKCLCESLVGSCLLRLSLLEQFLQ